MSGPVFAHGQLRLYLLALLERAPHYGYELIRGLSDQFGGTYRPSPGTIYPRLARLEEEGLIAKDAVGRKAVYRLTAAGQAELNARRGELRETEVEIGMTVRERAEALRRETLADARDVRQTIGRGGRPLEPPPGIGEQVAARARLKEAETLLTLFRAEARAELRMRAAGGRLGQQSVRDLRDSLDAALAALRASP